MARRLLTVSFLLAIAVAPAAAQITTGTILGTVKDPSGAVVPQARIVVRNLETGLTRTITTNASGAYILPELPLGHYTLRAEAPGFSTFVQTGLELHVQQNLRVDIALRVGKATQQVTVTGAPPLVNTVNATRSTVINNTTVVEMPLNGRYFNQLANLVPGVSPGIPGTTLQTLFAGGEAVWSYGQRDTSNEWNMDGASMNVGVYNWNGFNPPIDAIQEFTVQTGMYPAQFGFQAGANVNIAIKSGTNHLHGTLYDFLRNDAFDARDFFSATVPKLTQNQFGATIGGPVVLPKIYNGRDKTFFFFSYEGLRSSTDRVGNFVVPSLDMRSGNFTHTYTGAVYTGTLIDPSTGLPYSPTNILPSISSQATKILNYYPKPNQKLGAVFNYQLLAPVLNTDNEYIARVDHRFSDADTMFVHYAQDLRSEPSPAFIPGFSTFTTLGAHNVAGSETHILSPHTLNHAEIAVNRSFVTDGTPRTGTNFSAQQTLGIPDIPTSSPEAAAFPLFTIQNYLSLGDPNNYPVIQPDTEIQFTDNLTLVRGHHTLNIGADIRRRRMDRFQGIYTGGQFNFADANPAGTGNAFADFLLGLPEESQLGIAPAQIRMRESEMAFYVQDDWNATKKLTLNLGLRYELRTVPYDTRGTVASFNFATGQPITLSAGQGFYDPHHLNFAPRFGFAYRPLQSDKLVIRGGYGIFYNDMVGGGLWGLSSNPPFATQLNYFASAVTPITFDNPFPSAIPGQPATLTPSYHGISPQFGPGYAQARSFDIQYQLTPSTMVDVGYFGSFTVGEDLIIQQNTAPPGPGPVQPRRPFPNYGLSFFTENIGKAWYNGLTIKVERRLSKGLTFMSSYTWSKTMDMGFSSIAGQPDFPNYPQDPNHIQGSLRGLAGADRPHLWTTSLVYSLPVGSGRTYLSNGGVAADILGGWQVTGIATLQSGEPFGVTMPNDYLNVGGVVDTALPNRVCDGNLPSSQRSLSEWFDTSCFVPPLPYTYGNEGRDVLRGPGYFDIDTGMFKNINVSDRAKLQFRAEFFNVTNHPNFGIPGGWGNNPVGSPTFGVIGKSVGNPRIMQFALKLIY